MGTLAPPAYATQVDIFFNNDPVDVIEIGAIDAYNPLYPAADYTFYIVWDELNTVDQQRLIDLIEEYGDDVPFAAAVDGFQVLDYQGNVVGGNATGLDDTAAIAGSHTYLYSAVKVGGDPTNLPLLNNDGVNERTRFVVNPVNENEYFLLSDTTTDFYVWYDFLAVAPIIDVELPAIPANGEYFDVTDPSTDYYVWYHDRGAKEIFDLDFTGVDGASLSGSEYFTFDVNGGSAFYTWFNKPLPETFEVDFAGVGGGLNNGTGRSWTFSDDVNDFYVWYKRQARATSAAFDSTGTKATFEVDVTGNAVTGVSVINDGAGYADGTGFTFDLDGFAGGTNAIIEYDVVGGEVTNESVSAGGSGYTNGSGQAVDASFIPDPDGTSPKNTIAAGDHFFLSTPSTSRYFWFTIDGAGADPTPGGTGTQIDLLSTDGAIQTTEKSETAVRSTGDFLVTDTGQRTFSTVTNELGGNGNPTGGGTTGLSVVITESGQGEGNDPALPGIGIEVDIDNNETDTEVRNKTLLEVDNPSTGDDAILTVDVAGAFSANQLADVDFAGHTIVAGDHWTLNFFTGPFYVWYTVDAAGADPAPGGTGILVAILSGDSDAVVASKTAAIVSATFTGTAVRTPGSTVVRVTDTGIPVPVTAPADFNAGVAVTSLLVGGEGNVVYDTAIVNAGSGYASGVGFTQLLPTTAGGGDGLAEITYDVVSGAVTNTFVSAVGSTYTAGLAQTVTDFPAAPTSTPKIAWSSVGAETLRGILNVPVNVTDAADVDTGAAVTVTQQGSAMSTDPAPGGTGIQVDIDGTETDAEVAELTIPEINTATGGLASPLTPVIVRVVNSVEGDETDAADVNSGVVPTVVQDGTTNAAADPTPGGTGIGPVTYFSGIEGTDLATVVEDTRAAIDAEGDFAAADEGTLDFRVTFANVGEGDIDTATATVNTFTVVEGWNAGIDPAPGGTGIAVSVDGNASITSAQTAQNTKEAMDITLAGLISTFRVGNTLTTTVDLAGPANSAPSAGTSSHVVTLLEAGSVDSARTFTATVHVDNEPTNISILGSTATTFTTLIAELNADLPAAAAEVSTADFNGHAIVGGDYWTLSSPTTDYYVWYTVDAGGDDPAPAGRTAIPIAILGADADSVVAVKTAAVIDALGDFGVPVPGAGIITITNAATGPAQDIADVNAGIATAVSAQGSNGATAAIIGGNITITNDTVGETSVFIVDGDLFMNTQDQLRLDTPVRSEAVFYQMTVKVDGVAQDVVIAGENADTFTNFVAELTAEIAGATTAISGGNITIESNTPGNGGSIEVLPQTDEVFPNTNDFFNYMISRPGADEFVDMLYLGKDFGGDLHFFKYAVRGIGAKPPVGNTYNDSTATYFNGADWVRLVDDTVLP